MSQDGAPTPMPPPSLPAMPRGTAAYRPAARGGEILDSGLWRSIPKYSVGAALFIAMLALLTSLLLFQLTAEGASKRTLRRAVAALTEIDVLIERHYDELQRQADTAAPSDTMELQDYPIAVPLTRADVQGASKAQLRDLLLDRSADALYARGTAPLRDAAAGSGNVGRFSIAGLTRHALGFLRTRNHDILGVLTFVLAAVCTVLAMTLAVLCRGFGRIASVGGVVLAAAIPVAVGGIAARFFMRIQSGNDTEYVQREFLEIGQGLAWIPIRDGLAFTVLGATFLALGIAGAIWADRRGSSRYSAGRPHTR
jgi:hypothetical protein